MFSLKEYAKKYLLFIFNDMCPGQVAFLPKGVIMIEKMKSIISFFYKKNGYKEVSSFSIAQDIYWKQTGHLDKYISNMYQIDDHMLLKPMNCPMHMIIAKDIYNSNHLLPIMLYEFNYCFRKENSGNIGGIFRLIRFTQDDVHIITITDKIQEILFRFYTNIITIYKKFCITNITFRISRTDSSFIGDNSKKERLEEQIIYFFKKNEINFIESNDGAFYGPKIDIIIKDSQHRDWQVGTIQLDLCTLERINFPFQNEHKQQDTILIHQAIFGTFERFLGIVIEHNSNIPCSITPYFAVFITIHQNNKHIEYSQEIINSINRKYDDIDTKFNNEHINMKIKKSYHYKYICIIGENEVKDNNISIIETTNNNKYLISRDKLINLFIQDDISRYN